MMKYLFALLLCITSCAFEPNNNLLYKDIKGEWIPGKEVTKWDSTKTRLYRDPYEFWSFGDTVYVWREKYFIDTLGIVLSYRYTQRYRGLVYTTDTPLGELTSILFNLVDSLGQSIGDSYTQRFIPYALERDSLVVIEYGKQGLQNNTTTFSRYNLDSRKDWWRYKR